MSFPVSIKGVLLDGDRVALLENERGEWELTGGRLQADKLPAVCLVREFDEELGIITSSIVGSTRFCRSGGSLL